MYVRPQPIIIISTKPLMYREWWWCLPRVIYCIFAMHPIPTGIKHRTWLYVRRPRESNPQCKPCAPLKGPSSDSGVTESCYPNPLWNSLRNGILKQYLERRENSNTSPYNLCAMQKYYISYGGYVVVVVVVLWFSPQIYIGLYVSSFVWMLALAPPHDPPTEFLC